MIKNYLIIALRKFARNKFFSFINILGLGIGISAALVIYLIVQHEFSFEKFQPDVDRIYRVVSDLTFESGSQMKISGVPNPMPVAVRKDITGIGAATHFITIYQAKVAIPVTGNQSPLLFKKQKSMVYADEYYFSIFKYDWLAGASQTALKDPYQVVLTESRAKAYFGNIPYSDMLGRKIIYDDSITSAVAGIVKDYPPATDFKFNEFISLSTALQSSMKDDFNPDAWQGISSSSQLFVRLTKGTSTGHVESQFAGLRKKYMLAKADFKDDTKHRLQHLSDIHFNAAYDAFQNRQAHKPTLYGLLAVATFLLLLGCINFINLTTAQSILRAKEIGIRKTAGCSKSQIILQFLSETFVLTILATILSLLLVPFLLKMFEGFIPPEITFSSFNQLHVWLFMLSLVILVTLLSGLYPAWVLTKFNPALVLKGQLQSGSSKGSKIWIRKTLTVTQFVIAQFLIIATLVVSKQIHYSMNRDLGYKKDAIVYFPLPWISLPAKKDLKRYAFLEKIKTIPEIEKATLAGAPPADNGTNSTSIKMFNGKETVNLTIEVKQADSNYFDIYQMKKIAGRWPETRDTLFEYAINETAMKTMGFAKPEQVIGKLVDRGKKSASIVGVIADFNTKSTHEAIKPLAFTSMMSSGYAHIALKPRGNDPDRWKNGLAKVEKEYREFYPEDDFSYTFFDATIANFYKSEENISSLLKWASGLCIFISCLGLLGLVIYITNTRNKEIGIRKVLGATVIQIVSLLSKDFIALVLVAFIIVLPISLWTMHRWLQDFAYRTTLSWWLFAITGAGMVLIALLVLGIRTFKSATENPVKNLRTE